MVSQHPHGLAADRQQRHRITQALNGWTNPTEASIALAYGGTRLVPAASILNCGVPPVAGAASITFEDPDDDITTSGVIAIGGACSTGAARIVNGTSFARITYGFVVFTTRAEMPQLGQSLFLARVAEHEVGHAIGLGHTQTKGTVASADEQHHVSVVLSVGDAGAAGDRCR